MQGNKIKGILYGDRIGGHEEALVYNGIYEIANAPIRPAQIQYKRDPTEVAYTIGFGGKTLIRPLSSAPGPFLPDYQCVSQIPKTATPYDIFDVIGTVLYVEPTAREVTTKQGRKNIVTEIVLTDHSTDQPIVVSAWNDLAEDDCSKLASLTGNLPVVAFTALRVTSHRGFSLTSTMSTSISTSPTGDKVVALSEWITRNREILSELQSRIRKVRDPNAVICVVTLYALKSKKARHTLQDERYRLKVTVANPDLQKVNAYLGCSYCGKRSGCAAGERFKCETCTKEGALSEPRITFNCEVSDGTEQLEITTFTEDTVKLFRMSAPDIFHMRHSGDHLAFEDTRALLKDEPFTIEVSPKTALTRNNILQWALRTVILETDETTVKSPLTQTNSKEHPTTVASTQEPAPVARQLDFGTSPEKEDSLVLVDVSIRADYPSMRKLPASITTIPQTSHLQTIIPAKAFVTAKTAEQAMPLTSATLQHRAMDAETQATIAGMDTPMLKSPTVEKPPACTPETPAQATPKRNTTKQTAGSPAKKKKPTTGSSPGH